MEVVHSRAYKTSSGSCNEEGKQGAEILSGEEGRKT